MTVTSAKAAHSGTKMPFQIALATALVFIASLVITMLPRRKSEVNESVNHSANRYGSK